MGLILIIFSRILGTPPIFPQDIILIKHVEQFTPILFIATGVILILFGVLSFFIARGLWKGQKWTRIIVIIFSLLAIITTLLTITKTISIIGSILRIILNLIIILYLIFNTKVREFFS